MGSHVGSKIASCCARVVALCTNKGLLPWMGLHVLPKIASLCAGKVTLFAIIWLFSWMCERVHFEFASFFARVVALWTNKGLLSAVNSHVDFQFRRCITREAALVAIVTFLCITMQLVGLQLKGHLENSVYLPCAACNNVLIWLIKEVIVRGR